MLGAIHSWQSMSSPDQPKILHKPRNNKNQISQ